MLNKCIFMGRLTKAPEIRYTQGNEPVPVARFSLAVERNFQSGGQKTTDFFEIEAWRKRAEFSEKYLRKGQLIVVEGSIQQYQWEDKDKNKRTGYKLTADNIYFAEGKKRDDNVGNPPQTNDGAVDSMPSGFDPFATEESIADPFAGEEDSSLPY